MRVPRRPLSPSALLSSANFARCRLPVDLARRIQALRNLPFIVVSNPNIARIYRNYCTSLEALLPYWRASAISTSADEAAFTDVVAALVAAHTDTIPVLARGFLECRRYLSAAHVTRFLDQHLRARIGTRLVAEQHLALHAANNPNAAASSSSDSSYVGVIDTALCPTRILDACAGFVADICKLRYGLRPRICLQGQLDATLAFVPMHLEYMATELLKNAFRATVESRAREPVVITIAPEPPETPASTGPAPGLTTGPAPGLTIRIRDRGGGIPPDVLPHIWSYSFTTFSDNDADNDLSPAGPDGLAAISSAAAGGSSIAGLGYGLPLSRAYAEYFGGGIAVQSLYGWGTDVYLRLKGVAATPTESGQEDATAAHQTGMARP